MKKSQRTYENKPDSPSNNNKQTSEQELFITCYQCHVVYNYSQTKPVFLANGEESGERICDDCRIQNVKKTTRCNLRVCSSSQYKANSFRTLPSKFFDLPDGRYKREIIQQFGINKGTKACCNLCYIKLTKAALIARQSIDFNPEFSTDTEADENNNNHDDENIHDSDPKPTLLSKRNSLHGKYTSNDVTSWVDKIKKRRERSVKQTSDTNADSFQSRPSLSSIQTNKEDKPSTSDNQINKNVSEEEKILEYNLSTTDVNENKSSGIIKSSQPATSIKEIELSSISNVTLPDTTPCIADNASGNHSNEQNIQSKAPGYDYLSDKDKSSAVEKKEIILIDAFSDSDNDSVIIIDEPINKEAVTNSIHSELDGETADDSSSSDSQPVTFLCETCDNLVEKGMKECFDCSRNRQCIVLDCKTRKEELELKELPIKYSKLSRSEKKVFQRKFGLSKVSQKACNFCHKWIVYTLDTVFGELDSSERNQTGQTLSTENGTVSENLTNKVLSCFNEYGKKHTESIFSGTREDIDRRLPTSTALNVPKSFGQNPVLMKPNLARRTPQINTSTVTSSSILLTRKKATDVAPESTKVVPNYPISLSQVTNSPVEGVELTKSLEETGSMSTFLGEVNRKEKVVPIKLNTNSLPPALTAKMKSTSTMISLKNFTTSSSSTLNSQPVSVHAISSIVEGYRSDYSITTVSSCNTYLVVSTVSSMKESTKMSFPTVTSSSELSNSSSKSSFQSVVAIDSVVDPSRIHHSVTTVSSCNTYPVVSSILSRGESTKITTNHAITSSSKLPTCSKSLIQSVDAIGRVMERSRTNHSVTTVSSCNTYPVVSTVSSMRESTKMTIPSVSSSSELSNSSKSMKNVDAEKDSNKLSESLRLSLEKARKYSQASTSSSKPTIHQFNHESKGVFEVSRSFKKGKAISGKSQFLKPGRMVNSGKCKFSICALPNQIQQLFHFSHFWDSCTPMQTVIINQNFKIKKLKKSVCCYSCFKELKWYLAFLNDEIMEKISIEKTGSSKKKIFYVCQVDDCKTTQKKDEPIHQWLHCYDDLLEDLAIEYREGLIKKFYLDETGKGFCCYSCLHKIRLYLDSGPNGRKKVKVNPPKTTEPDVSTLSPTTRTYQKIIQDVSVCQPITCSTASIITDGCTDDTPVTSVNVILYPKPHIATQSDKNEKYPPLVPNALYVESKFPSRPESSILSTQMIITTDANNVGYENDASIYPVVDKVVSLGRTSYQPPLKELTPTLIKIQGDNIYPVESSISKKPIISIASNSVSNSYNVTSTKDAISIITPSYYFVTSKQPPLKTIPILPKCHLVPIPRATTAVNQVVTIPKPTTLPNHFCAETQTIVKSILQKQAITTDNSNPYSTNQISIDSGTSVNYSSTTPSASSTSRSTHLSNTPICSKGLTIIASKFMSQKKPYISPTGKHETSRKLDILTSNCDNMNSIIKQQHTSKPIEQNNQVVSSNISSNTSTANMVCIVQSNISSASFSTKTNLVNTIVNCSKQDIVSDRSNFSSVSSTAKSQVSATSICQSSTVITSSNEFGAFCSVSSTSSLDVSRKSAFSEQGTTLFDEKNGDSSEELMTKAVEYVPGDIEYFDSTTLFDFSKQYKQVPLMNSSEKKVKSDFSSEKATLVIDVLPAKGTSPVKGNHSLNASSSHLSSAKDVVNTEDTSLDKSVDISFDESREDVKSPVFLPASLIFPNKFKVSDPKQSASKIMREKYIDFEKSPLLPTFETYSAINISSQNQMEGVNKLSGNTLNENSRNVALPHSSYTKESLKTIDTLHTTMSIVESKEKNKHVVPEKKNILGNCIHGKNIPVMVDKMCQSDFMSETSHQQISQQRAVSRSTQESSCTKQTQTQDILKLDKICQTGLIYVNGSRDGCVGGTLKEPYTALPEANLKKAVRKEAKELLEIFMRKLDELTLGCGKEILSELTHSKDVGLAAKYRNLVIDQGQLYRQTDGKDKNERLRLLSSVSLHSSNLLLRTHFRRYSPKGDLICVNEDEIKQSRVYAERFGPGRPVFTKNSAPTTANAVTSGNRKETPSTHTTTKKTKAQRTSHKPVTSSTAEFFDDVVSPLTLLADASASIAKKDLPSTDNGEIKETSSSELHISPHSTANKMQDDGVTKNTFNEWVSFSTQNKRKADSNISDIYSKKKRTKFTDEEVNVLEQFYIDITQKGKKRDIQEVQNSLPLDKRTISRWLRNRKYKEKQDEYVRNLKQMVTNNGVTSNNRYDSRTDNVDLDSLEGSIQDIVDFSNCKENSDMDRNSDGEVDVVTVGTFSDVETETDTIPYGSENEGIDQEEGEDENDNGKEGKELQSKDRKSSKKVTELADHGVDEKTISNSTIKEPSDLFPLDSCPMDTVPTESCYERGFSSSHSVSSKSTSVCGEMIISQQNAIRSDDCISELNKAKSTSSNVPPSELKTLLVKPCPATKPSDNEMSQASQCISEINSTSAVTTTPLGSCVYSTSPVDFVLSESPRTSSSSRDTTYQCVSISETPVDPVCSSETPNIPALTKRLNDTVNFNKTPINPSSTDNSYDSLRFIETPEVRSIEKRIEIYANEPLPSPNSDNKTHDQKEVIKTLDFLLSSTSTSHHASTHETHDESSNGIEEANACNLSVDKKETRHDNFTNTTPSVSEVPPLLIHHQTMDSSKLQHLRPDLLSSQPPVLKTSHIAQEMINLDENIARSSLDREAPSVTKNITDKDPASCNDVIVSVVSETCNPIGCPSPVDLSASQSSSPIENSTIVSSASEAHSPGKGVSFVDSTLSETYSSTKTQLSVTNTLSETHLDVDSQSSVILTNSVVKCKKIIENNCTEKTPSYPNRTINESCSLKRKICEIVPSFSDDESPQSSFDRKDVLISYKSPKKGKVIWYHRPDKVSEVNRNFIQYKKKFGLNFCTVDVVPLELTDLMKYGRYIRRLNRKRSVKPDKDCDEFSIPYSYSKAIKQGVDTKSIDPIRPNKNIHENDDPILLCASSTDTSSNTSGRSIEEEKRNIDTQIEGDLGFFDVKISNKSAPRHLNQRLSNISNNLSLIIPERKKSNDNAVPDFVISEIGDEDSNDQSIDYHDMRFEKNISKTFCDMIPPALISCSISESSVAGDSPQPPVLTPYLPIPRTMTSNVASKSPSIDSPPVLIPYSIQDKIM